MKKKHATLYNIWAIAKAYDPNSRTCHLIKKTDFLASNYQNPHNKKRELLLAIKSHHEIKKSLGS